MKYIIFENHSGNDCPIIFPGWMDHDDVAKKFSYVELKSAGFVSVGQDGKAQAYGRSISLKLNSSPNDSQLINDLLKSSY